MSQAYAFVLVSDEALKDVEDCMKMAERAAYDTFEKLAAQHGNTTIVVDPEPVPMTVKEMKAAYPYINLKGIKGFKYLAELS
jgi:hypothetical protein